MDPHSYAMLCELARRAGAKAPDLSAPYTPLTNDEVEALAKAIDANEVFHHGMIQVTRKDGGEVEPQILAALTASIWLPFTQGEDFGPWAKANNIATHYEYLRAAIPGVTGPLGFPVFRTVRFLSADDQERVGAALLRLSYEEETRQLDEIADLPSNSSSPWGTTP